MTKYIIRLIQSAVFSFVLIGLAPTADAATGVIVLEGKTCQRRDFRGTGMTLYALCYDDRAFYICWNEKKLDFNEMTEVLPQWFEHTNIRIDYYSESFDYCGYETFKAEHQEGSDATEEFFNKYAGEFPENKENIKVNGILAGCFTYVN